MWWSKRWRRIFEDLEKEIEEMEKMFDEEFSKIFESMKSGKPYVYGFSITIGPDGKPIIRRFGNVEPPWIVREEGEEYRTPFVDVFTDEKTNEVKIVVELPGVSKDEINLEATEKTLTIETTGERKYRTKVDLPVEVDPDSAKANYNNGVLEVVLKPKEELKKGKKIKIE